MSITKKPIFFTILAAITISIGTIATVFVPMFLPSTQPHNSLQKVYTPLELAGRDVYQAEGCNNCHTQTVRPLKAEVARYGPYSKAWEFEYDRPFLWGSKRTGPDLARVGGKYSDQWHYRHFEDPPAMIFGSNMPAYGFLADNALDPSQVEAHIMGIGFPFNDEQIAELAGKTELDALVAYIQYLGTAVPRPQPARMIEEGEKNPFLGPQAIAKGQNAFLMNCTGCHTLDSSEDSSIDENLISLDFVEDFEDWEIFETINNGTIESFKRRDEGGMPPFGEFMGKEKIWSVVSYIRTIIPKLAAGADNEDF